MKKFLYTLLIAGVALVVIGFIPKESYAFTQPIPCSQGSEVVCNRWHRLGEGVLERECFCADINTGNMTGGSWVERISLAP